MNWNEIDLPFIVGLTERIMGQAPGRKRSISRWNWRLIKANGRVPTRSWQNHLDRILERKKKKSIGKKKRGELPAVERRPPTTAEEREGGLRGASSGRVKFPRVASKRDAGSERNETRLTQV
jgi:hypothetical protein